MITTPCYATREEVKTSPDFQGTAYNNAQIDRAIQAASRDVEGQLNRKFYPEDTTKYFDWPASGGSGGGWISYPWRIYFDQNELASIPTQVQSPPGTNLTVSNINFEPVNSSPPYTYMETQRDKKDTFSSGPTPQRSVSVTGTFGYTATTNPAGILAAAVSSTSTTTITVSDGSQLGVGDLAIIDSERMLVQEKSTVTTTDSQQGSGVSTASSSDATLALTSGLNVNLNEVILLDSEKMLVQNITANNVTVKRAYDGTVLATHSGATVYAYRVLTVARGQLGTVAATHLISTAVSRHHVPLLIKELAVAEAVNAILQETSGYARSQPIQGSNAPVPGGGLPDLRNRVRRSYARKARLRSV